MPFRPERYLVGGNRAKLRRAFYQNAEFNRSAVAKVGGMRQLPILGNTSGGMCSDKRRLGTLWSETSGNAGKRKV
jgi:hypothetical protein